MNNLNNQFLSPPSIRHQPVRRSTSFGSGRLHFDYTGRDSRLQVLEVTPRPRLSTNVKDPPPLVRQSTVDILLPNASAPNGLSSSIAHSQFNPRNTTTPSISIQKETTNVNLTTPKLSPLPSTSQISHPTKDVTLTTSSFPLRSPDPHLVTNAASIGYSWRTTMPTSYGNSLYSFRSDDSFRNTSLPHAPLSSHLPTPLQTTETTISKAEPHHSQLLERSHAPTPVEVDQRPPEAVISPPIYQQLPPISSQTVHYQMASGPNPRPLSLNSQFDLDMNMRSKTLTIGYSTQQRQQIEEAQRIMAENMRKQEAETRTKLEAQKMESGETKKKLKMDENTEEEKSEEKMLPEEPETCQLAENDDDDELNHFINRLNSQIEDSRNSKNWEGALAGRQNTQNPAKFAESLTNASKNENEAFEGRDVANQGSTQSVADSSEEYTFLERLKNMKTDRNANRRKFAEHYYDFDDDDSELHSSASRNSMLSIVTEEELLDSASLNNMPILESQTDLQPSLMSYVDKLVDDIFSSVKKTDLLSRLNPPKKFTANDLYVTDEDVSYISENAKQFFTPRNSADADPPATETEQTKM